MKLSADMYYQLVSSLRTEPRRGGEQRSSARAGIGGPLTIQLTNGAQPWNKDVAVRLRDLGIDGIGFSSPVALVKGDQFTIALQRKGASDVVLFCQVRHCSKVADGIFNIGARFVDDNARDARLGSAKKENDVRRAVLG